MNFINCSIHMICKPSERGCLKTSEETKIIKELSRLREKLCLQYNLTTNWGRRINRDKPQILPNFGQLLQKSHWKQQNEREDTDYLIVFAIFASILIVALISRASPAVNALFSIVFPLWVNETRKGNWRMERERERERGTIKMNNG